eukprot:jgi/Tetstr1/425077/TSEL_015541.t1
MRLVCPEGYPTLAWNVNVGHRKWIFLSTVPLFAGDHNDKTIVRDEPFIREVRENKLFTEATRQTYRFDGNLREPMGVHAINDGGYHIRWRETRAGQKPDEAGALAMAVALALSESVPSNVTTKEQLDDMFRSCSTLYIMVSQYDGLNTVRESDDGWEPLEMDAIGGTTSAAVEMIEEQMRIDANPEGLPNDFVDSDVDSGGNAEDMGL